MDVTCILTTDTQVMLPVLTARDCLEGRPMPVQVDLATSTIPIASSLGGIAEQRVWKSFEGSELRFVTLSADVDDDTLTLPSRTVMTLTQFVARRRRLPVWQFVQL